MLCSFTQRPVHKIHSLDRAAPSNSRQRPPTSHLATASFAVHAASLFEWPPKRQKGGGAKGRRGKGSIYSWRGVVLNPDFARRVDFWPVVFLRPRILAIACLLIADSLMHVGTPKASPCMGAFGGTARDGLLIVDKGCYGLGARRMHESYRYLQTAWASFSFQDAFPLPAVE
ncbi:hypothetical protein GQ54DRAFT_68511 [Martensiomyces pterosporus]|nr:hypothetical protein GQ54DRAFT_68511 [Martensiomyces pterosporus]